MSKADQIHAMCTEDGDRWFAEGHHPDEAMRAAAARAESEAIWREVTAEDFADGSVFRGWFILIHPDDEESPMQRVDEGTPGAQAWTVLDADLDWDSIDRRPERRPDWAQRQATEESGG